MKALFIEFFFVADWRRDFGAVELLALPSIMVLATSTPSSSRGGFIIEEGYYYYYT